MTGCRIKPIVLVIAHCGQVKCLFHFMHIFFGYLDLFLCLLLAFCWISRFYISVSMVMAWWVSVWWGSVSATIIQLSYSDKSKKEKGYAKDF